MQIEFFDKRVQMPENVHEYATKKISKLGKYFNDYALAHATFSVEAKQNVVELTIRDGSLNIRANESTGDMFASIDAAVSVIERKIQKNKTKLEKKIKTPAKQNFSDLTDFVEFDLDEEETEPIIKIKSFEMKPITRSEAILQMELLGHSFFAFKDADNEDKFAVLYTRKDGKYGLIEDK